MPEIIDFLLFFVYLAGMENIEVLGVFGGANLLWKNMCILEGINRLLPLRPKLLIEFRPK